MTARISLKLNNRFDMVTLGSSHLVGRADQNRNWQNCCTRKMHTTGSTRDAKHLRKVVNNEHHRTFRFVTLVTISRLT